MKTEIHNGDFGDNFIILKIRKNMNNLVFMELSAQLTELNFLERKQTQ